MEEINDIPKTLGTYYKRGSSHQQNSFSNKESELKDPLKNFFKSQKNRKGEKHYEGSWDRHQRIHLDSRRFKPHKSWKLTKSYLSLWLLNLYEPFDTSQWKEGSNVLKLNIMKYHSIFWGSLTPIPVFSLFPYFSLAIYFTICICLHVWICICCRAHVLCTTLFVISLI